MYGPTYTLPDETTGYLRPRAPSVPDTQGWTADLRNGSHAYHCEACGTTHHVGLVLLCDTHKAAVTT